MIDKQHYQIMSLGKTATHKEIIARWKTLAKKYHPDNLSSGDSEYFQRIKKSYDVLSDPQKKAEYDEELRQKKDSKFHSYNRHNNDISLHTDRNRTGLKWTRNDDVLIKKYFALGNQLSEIAFKLHRDDNAIFYHLHKMGLIGFKDDKIIPANHNRPWNIIEENNLIKEYHSGYNIVQIAKIHKRQKNAILCKLVKYNLVKIHDIERIVDN